MTPEPRMRSCPSFNGCRAPVCPLETIYPSSKRFKMKGEAVCVASKPTRYRLGEGLKFLGLFVKEYQMTLASDGFDKLKASALGQKGKVALKQAIGDELKQVK